MVLCWAETKKHNHRKMSFLRGFFCFILFFSFFLSSSRTFFSVYLNYFQFEKLLLRKYLLMLTAAKSIYLLTMVLLKIFISTQDELSFAKFICNINFLLIFYAIPEIRFSRIGLTPSRVNCRLLQSTVIRRFLCFDRTGSKNKLLLYSGSSRLISLGNS